MRGKSINRRLPFKTEILEYSRRKLHIYGDRGNRECDRAWAAAAIRFAFLLRASEPEAREFRDVTFGGNEGNRYVGGNEGNRYVLIFIRNSKTDQSEVGVFRILGEAGVAPISKNGKMCRTGKSGDVGASFRMRNPPSGNTSDQMGSRGS